MSDQISPHVGGVKCVRPLTNTKAQYAPPRIVDQWAEEGTVYKENVEEPDKSLFFRFEKNRLIIECMGTQVYFSKSSRGRGKFQDSREPDKRFDRDEIRAEIYRMLGDSYETDRAMTALEFG